MRGSINTLLDVRQPPPLPSLRGIYENKIKQRENHVRARVLMPGGIVCTWDLRWHPKKAENERPEMSSRQRTKRD